MNKNNIKQINYKFARNILPRIIHQNPGLFYEKCISRGYPSFISSLKAAWLNTAKSFGDVDISLNNVDINLEINHVYGNGDFILLVSLPFTSDGCDMIGFYIREEDSMDFNCLDGNIYESIEIDYYIFFKANYVDKYTLLEVDKDTSLKNNGYVSASEELLLKKLYKLKNKRSYMWL